MINDTKINSYKGPTMRDVAAAANVSLSTVSLVVNGKPGVSPDRRERVLKVIKELNYATGGRKKSTVETKIIGLLMESLSEASRSEGFYLRIVSGIEEAAYELGYQVFLHVYRPAVDPLNSIRELMGRDVDGLIIANDGDITPNMIQNIAETNIPLVLVENFQNLPIHSVTADNFTAGCLMTEYLIRLGHRRIGALGGPDKYSSLRDRMRGHCIAMLENGLQPDPSLQPSPVSRNPRKGYVQMQKLIALPEPPTAVFAVSDRAAFGAMEAIKDAGLVCPDDISVVGIDDVRDSAYSTPSLTTFSVPKYELGRTAVLMLHNLTVNRALPPARTVLLGNILVRQSAAPPRQKPLQGRP
ncbi:MAG TPA: LacI family DNA-binding transcriptional regulator [Anaerolineales bacterium]|nr:LacI family DNA-binding transcriptional regulator [Anaerolineales bacterium]